MRLSKFSSIFGSMNMKNWDNVITCFDGDFQLLFDEKNLVCTIKDPKFDYENKKHGCRTLHRVFDDIDDYHSSTIAHHDLSDVKSKQHFQRGLERLRYMKEKNLPILFVDISSSTEFDNTVPNKLLAESIIKNGFTNMKILSIWKDETGKTTVPTLVTEDTHHIIYKMPSYGYYSVHDDPVIRQIIERHFIVDKLLTIDDIPVSSE
jgi:hypothetical protein